MGCLYSTASHSSRVKPLTVGQASAEFRRDNTGLENSNEINHIRENSANQSLKDRNSARKQRHSITNSLRSSNSLDDDRSLDDERGLSATSKSSKHSTDSGLGDDSANIITEYSEQHLVEHVESNFCDKEGLQLEISGIKCPTRLSAKQKQRQEESLVLQALREEGFISKPKAQSSGGISFEIVKDVSDENKFRPPARLAKLENKRKKKKILTEEQIKEKLERAERRRKEREEEKVKKIKILEKSETIGPLEVFAQRQKQKLEEQTERMGSAVDNREKRLVEVREKIKERERHAEEVRKRKQINLDCMTPESEYGNETKTETT